MGAGRTTFDENRRYYEVRLNRSLPAREKVSVCCPFHDDHDPSETVFLDSGGFHCNGCNAKGSIIDFEMRFSNCDRETAVKNIEEITGASLNGSGWKPVATYQYRNSEFVPVARKKRYLKPDGEKTFSWDRRDDKGRWQKGLADDTPRLLYNQPELTTANLVLFAEGEGCCDALTAVIPMLWPERQASGLRITTTTNPEGAWKPGEKPKWRPGYNRHFGGKPQVVLFEDNDSPGRTLVDHVATQIHSYTDEARIITFRDQREKYDIGDWIKEHSADPERMIADLQRMIESAPIWKPTAQSEAAGLRLHPLGELLSRPVVPVDWLLEGRLVAGSVGMTVSKPKVGKSTLARNLALAVARGEPFLGWETKQGSVIYLNLEERLEDVISDFRAMGADGSEPIQFAEAGSVNDVLALLLKTKPVLLVVDPLFRLVRAKDEKAYAEMYNHLGPLIDTARETGTHILCLHHSSKQTKEDTIDSPLGSSALGGAISTLFEMRKSSTGMRTLRSVQRIGESLDETVLEFDAVRKSLRLGGTREEAEIASVSRKILDALNGSDLLEREINDAIEGRTIYKRRAIRELVEAGQLLRAGTGLRGAPYRYRLACSSVPNDLLTRSEVRI